MLNMTPVLLLGVELRDQTAKQTARMPGGQAWLS